MASKRIDELDARTVADTDLLPVTPSGGPSGKATVAAIVAEGLSQPNSASAGAGASITIKAADGVTSGAGGSIVLQPGAQATTGGNGTIIIRQPGGTAGTNECQISNDGAITTFNSKNGEIYLYITKSQGVMRVARGDVSTRYIDFNPDANGFGSITTSQTGGIRFDSSIMMNQKKISFSNGGNTEHASFSINASQAVIRVLDGSTGGGSLAYASSTPAAIVANQNDYVLTGSAFQRLNCTTASDITGIAPPTGGAHVNGRMIRLVSVGTATVTLKHNDAASTAANRIYMHGGNHTSLTVNEWADLVYDSTDNGSGAAGWRVVKYAL